METRQFGLDRKVEMLQWRSDAAGYVQVWNVGAIDSTGFGDAHRNPGELPIVGQRWWATDATLNGKPLEAAKTYRVAGWAPVSEEAKDSGPAVWDVVANYLRGQKVISQRSLNLPTLKGMEGNPGVAI